MSAVAVESEVWETRKEEEAAAAETDMAEAEADTAATVGGCERDCERIRLGTLWVPVGCFWLGDSRAG